MDIAQFINLWLGRNNRGLVVTGDFEKLRKLIPRTTEYVGSETTSIDDLMVVDEKMGDRDIFVDGPLLDAMRKGKCFILQNVEQLPQEVLRSIYFLEPYGTAVHIPSTGEIVHPHWAFRFIFVGDPGVDIRKGIPPLHII